MSGSNLTPDDEWIRLNVGGKIFETTMFTLSKHPESFLSRLVKGVLPSKKDKYGAFLIDRSYEHFDQILNYLRSGTVNFDRNKTDMKDFLCEAEFYGIKPLVDEIRNAVSPATNHTEIVKLFVSDLDNEDAMYRIYCSEKRNDYEVLQALLDKYELEKDDDIGTCVLFVMSGIPAVVLMEFEVIMRNFGFVKEFYDPNHEIVEDGSIAQYWMYVRTVSK